MSEFDKKVHIRNGKGEIVSQNHYVMHCNGSSVKFERPPKSGIFYDASGNLINKDAADNIAKDLVTKPVDAGQKDTKPAKS